MSADAPKPGFDETAQAGYGVRDEVDFTDADLLEALDCVAHEPGASGGHEPTSLEGRRAQLAYMNAHLAAGLREIEAGRVLSAAESAAILEALEEGRAPPIPARVVEVYGS